MNRPRRYFGLLALALGAAQVSAWLPVAGSFAFERTVFGAGLVAVGAWLLSPAEEAKDVPK